jgi:hypothetical protein
MSGYTVRKIYMARDGKYSHCTGKFTDTVRVKDQIEYFVFDFFNFFLSKYNKT